MSEDLPISQLICDDIGTLPDGMLEHIEAFGIPGRIVVTRHKDGFIVLDGRLRFNAAKRLGYKKVPTIRIDWKAEE